MEQRLETKAIFFAVVGISVNNSTSPTANTLPNAHVNLASFLGVAGRGLPTYLN
jgi:hypothetical protein